LRTGVGLQIFECFGFGEVKRMKSVKLWGIALAAALIMSVSGIAHAAPVVGSEALAGGGTTLSGPDDVMTATAVSWTSWIDTASKTGDYVAVGDFEVVSVGSSTLELHTGVPGTAWTIGSATWGTFLETSVSAIVIGSHAIAIYVDGTFTPGTDFPAGTGPSSATMIVGLTQVGGKDTAVSTSGTLVSPSRPPPGAPEINANVFFSAFSLLLGSVAVIFGRKKFAPIVG
jgi:hypothetical protein